MELNKARCFEMDIKSLFENEEDEKLYYSNGALFTDIYGPTRTWITNHELFIKFVEDSNLNRGDVFLVVDNEVDCCYYLYWNGVKIITNRPNGYWNNEYPPPEFKIITEFPIRYWSEAITTNNEVYLNLNDFKEELEANFQSVPIHHSYLTFKGDKYYLLFFDRKIATWLDNEIFHYLEQDEDGELNSNSDYLPEISNFIRVNNIDLDFLLICD